MPVKLALPGKLENKKDALRIVKMPIQPQDVGMPQVGLDLNLTPQLLLDPRLYQLMFLLHFESHNKARLADPGQIDGAKLAFAQSASNFKVFVLPVYRRAGTDSCITHGVCRSCLSARRGCGHRVPAAGPVAPLLCIVVTAAVSSYFSRGRRWQDARCKLSFLLKSLLVVYGQFEERMPLLQARAAPIRRLGRSSAFAGRLGILTNGQLREA